MKPIRCRPSAVLRRTAVPHSERRGPSPTNAIGLLSVAAAAWLGVAANASAESANRYLATPDQYAGKEIKLDVICVRPVRLTSPVPGVRWFHAFTEDDKKNALGGVILIALPDSAVDKFVKEFGLTNEGRTETLRGILHALPNRANPAVKVWFVDYKGLNADLITKHKDAGIDSVEPSAPPAPGGRRFPGRRVPGNP